MSYLKFGGFDTREVDVEIFQKYSQQTPERIYDRITIPGKDGVFIYDTGRFSNVPLEYGFIIHKNVHYSIVNLRNALLSRTGYQRLSDSFDPNEFYSAYYNGRMRVEYSRGGKLAKGTLTFERTPQRYLTSGERTTTITAASATLNNYTPVTAKPKIRVVGNGSFSINGKSVTVASHSYSYIDIDSELQDCYCGTTNCNSLVTFASGDFPALVPGDNTIAKADITSLAITPNWWRL